MKYFLFLTLLLLIDSCYSYKVNAEVSNRIKLISQFKMKSKTFLEKLDLTVNFPYDPQSIKNSSSGPERDNNSNSFLNNKVNYLQYEYKNYQEIVEILKALAIKYPNLIKLDTAQNLYNLPNPGGECGLNQQLCFHWIVTLTNHLKDSKNKPQVINH